MFDINEIRKRAQQASEHATDSMKKAVEKSEELISKIEVPSSEKSASIPAAEVEEQINANTQRQVEILGQIFERSDMAQMAVSQEQLQKAADEKAAAAAESLMEQLFGEDMGVLAAALEMLEMEDAGEEEARTFDLELEESLYTTLEETMARLEAMPEPEPIPYQKHDAKWERFGILLTVKSSISICSGVLPKSRASWVSVTILVGIRFNTKLRSGRIS